MGDEPAGLDIRTRRADPARRGRPAPSPPPSCCASATPDRMVAAGRRGRRGRPSVVSRGAPRARRRGHRSSAGRSPSPTSPIRPAPTSPTDPATASDDPEVAADLAAARAAGTLADDPAHAWGNARDPRLRDRPPGRGRPSIDPAADRLPLASPDEAARAPTDVRHRPGDARPRGLRRGPAARSPTASRAPSRSVSQDPAPGRAARGAAGDRLGDGAGGQPRRRGRPREPVRGRGDLRRRGRPRRSRLHRGRKLQRCRGAPAADRQGVGEHRRRAQAAPRPAAEPRRRGARLDGLRARRPDRGHRGAGRLLPDRPDPRPGRHVRGDERGGPLAVRGRRALPGRQVAAPTSRTSRTRSSGWRR